LDASGARLLATATDNCLHIFDCGRPLTARTEPLQTLRAHGLVTGSFFVKSCFSPDGRWVLAGSKDSHAYLFELDDPARPPLRLRGHGSEVTAVAWNGADFEQVHRCLSPKRDWLCRGDALTTVPRPAMTERGVSQLATCSDDMTVRLWRVDRARAQAHRDADRATDVDDFLGTAEEAPVFSPRRSPRRSPLRPAGSGAASPQRAAPGQLGPPPYVTVSPSLLQRTPSPPLLSSQSSYTSTPSPVRPANATTVAAPRARRALFAEPPPPGDAAAAASATTGAAARRRASDNADAAGPAKRTRQLRVDELVALSRPSSAPPASNPATAAV